MKTLIIIAVIILITITPALLKEVVDFDKLGKKIDNKSLELELKTKEIKRKRKAKK